VRELRNYVERCLTLHAPAPLAPDESPGRVNASLPYKEARERALREFERGYLQDLLTRHENNVTAAARAAGVDRIYLYRLLWRHGLR
jgi:two-component system, NtrC family, response regulator GlrR